MHKSLEAGDSLSTESAAARADPFAAHYSRAAESSKLADQGLNLPVCRRFGHSCDGALGWRIRAEGDCEA